MLNAQDLQRLIELITEEVIAAQQARPASSRCACHAVQQRLLSRSVAGGRGCGRHPARHARGRGGVPSGVAGDDRSHAAEAGRDARRDREAVPRGGRVQVRDRLRQPGLGGGGGAPAPRHRRRRVFGGRVSARGDDRRRQALRDAPGDLRRRSRDRHGHQRRRAEVGRPAHRRARHRGGGRALPAVRRDQQGDHRGRAPDRRGKDHRVHAVEGRRAPTS